MDTKQIAKDLASYEMLKTTITAHLNVYKELLNDYEVELKKYLKEDLPTTLIDVQNMLISKTKAKISALEELNQ